MMTAQHAETKPKTVELSATEKQLLKQIEAQAPAKASLIKFLSNAVCGFI